MVQLGCNRNDISYDGLPSDCSLNYISAFGKIYVQERFRVLFTLMNTSEKHQLQQVKLLIKLTCDTAKKKDRTLLQEEIVCMTAREVKNFPLEFKVENTGKYL